MGIDYSFDKQKATHLPIALGKMIFFSGSAGSIEFENYGPESKIVGHRSLGSHN